MSKPRILIVDDVAENATALRDVLLPQFGVSVCADGHEAWNQVLLDIPSLILLKFWLPGLDGLSLCRRLRANRRTSHVPIILIGAALDTSAQARAMLAGASDILTGPVSTELLLARVQAQLALQDQSQHLAGLVEQRTRALTEEMAKRNETIKRIKYQHHYSALTGLPNSRFLSKRIKEAASSGSPGFAVIHLDIDRFSGINDAMGAQFGDELLRLIARRLASGMVRQDVLGHIGGDMFAVLVHAQSGAADLPRLAAARVEHLLKLAAGNIELLGESVNVEISAGVALAPQDGNTADLLLKNATAAAAAAKEEMATRLCFYRKEMNSRSRDLLNMEVQFRAALDARLIKPWYQPKVCNETLRILGAESLARWAGPDGRLISPSDFIPLAENLGLTYRLMEIILHQTCLDGAAWIKRFGNHLKFAVNLSAADFQYPGLLDDLRAVLADTGMPAKNLELEVTEQAMVRDQSAAADQIAAIRGMGISVGLDDFGTGYSSLSYLKRFPIDTLKIDQSFVREIGRDQRGDAVLRTIADLSKHLGTACIAEGVETVEQYRVITGLGAAITQGWLFSPAVDAEKFGKLLGGPKFCLPAAA